MAWDSTERTNPCPCGKGKYSYTHKENDWGQSYSCNHTMHCPECAGNYVLAFNEYEVARMKSDGWYWKRKEENETPEEAVVRTLVFTTRGLKSIRPLSMDMKKTEILSIMDTEMKNCSFARHKPKEELIGIYNLWMMFDA